MAEIGLSTGPLLWFCYFSYIPTKSCRQAISFKKYSHMVDTEENGRALINLEHRPVDLQNLLTTSHCLLPYACLRKRETNRLKLQISVIF